MAMKFVHYQPNEADKNRKHGQGSDCVVRAITKVEHCEWMDTYHDLCEMGAALWAMPNADKTWKAYLTAKGYSNVGYKMEVGSSRLTVREFCDVNAKGEYILSLAGHLVAVLEGKYYDSWDCGNKKVYGYWTKEMNKNGKN